MEQAEGNRQETAAPERTADDNTIWAYRNHSDEGWALEPAPLRRDWMDATTQSFAYRCLPLVMANQMGWVVRIPAGLKATWNGKPGVDGMKVSVQGGPEIFQRQAVSHFGHGVLSFIIPWVFRTPKGMGLLVRGAPNFFVQNATPLEGLMETDWASTTFTMNWLFTARGKEVWFKAGDPICMLTPYPMDLLDGMKARITDMRDNPEMMQEVASFEKARAEHAAEVKRKFMAGEEKPFSWQLDYMRGKTVTGKSADKHRTQFRLKPFRSDDGSERPA